MTLVEIVDYINSDLTMSGALPCILPQDEIKRLVIKDALPWFYENYQWSVIKGYYLIPQENLKSEQFSKYKHITLPDEIQNIVWVYGLESRSLFELGVSAPNLSVNLGVTNQPHLSSFTTTVGELGVYKTVIDGFADMLNKLSKHTLKYDFNFGSKELHLLTYVDNDLIVESYIQIPKEDLFEVDKFRRYALALSKLQMGRMLTRYNFSLPGGIQMNGDAIKAEGQEELDKVREEIKGQSTTAWFFTAR